MENGIKSFNEFASKNKGSLKLLPNFVNFVLETKIGKMILKSSNLTKKEFLSSSNLGEKSKLLLEILEETLPCCVSFVNQIKLNNTLNDYTINDFIEVVGGNLSIDLSDGKNFYDIFKGAITVKQLDNAMESSRYKDDYTSINLSSTNDTNNELVESENDNDDEVEKSESPYTTGIFNRIFHKQNQEEDKSNSNPESRNKVIADIKSIVKENNKSAMNYDPRLLGSNNRNNLLLPYVNYSRLSTLMNFGPMEYNTLINNIYKVLSNNHSGKGTFEESCRKYLSTPIVDIISVDNPDKFIMDLHDANPVNSFIYRIYVDRNKTNPSLHDITGMWVAA